MLPQLSLSRITTCLQVFINPLTRRRCHTGEQNKAFLSVFTPRKWRVLRTEAAIAMEISREHFITHITIGMMDEWWMDGWNHHWFSHFKKRDLQILRAWVKVRLGWPCCSQRFMTGSRLERLAQSKNKVKSIACNGSPFPERPHASLSGQAMAFRRPPGRTKPPFRPVPAAIVQSRSNLFLLAARCEVTQPFFLLQWYSFARGLCRWADSTFLFGPVHLRKGQESRVDSFPSSLSSAPGFDEHSRAIWS